MQTKPKIQINFKDWQKFQGLNFYIPSYIRLRSVKPLDNLLVYTTYKQLFPNKPNSMDVIEKEYASYLKKDIIQSLCKVHYILETKYGGGNFEDYKVAADLLVNVNKQAFSELKGKSKFFTRQQMLANIKLALVYSSYTRRKYVKDNINDFSELIFKITDFLDSKRFKGKEEVVVNVLRNMVFNQGFNLSSAVARYSYIFNRVGEQIKHGGKTLRQIFSNLMGIDFNFYLSIGFAIWGFYEKRNFQLRLKEPKEFILSANYFKNTNKYTRVNHKKSIKAISNTFNGFKKDLIREEKEHGEFFSFQTFFRHPLIRDNKTYYLVDKTYLERRITSGSFWQMFDRLNSDKQKQDFSGYWGKLFERYVYDITKSVYKDTDRVLSEICGDKTEGVDIIIRYPSALFLVEITTRKIPYNVWITANPKTIKEYLYKLLIKGERRGKAIQLYELWKKIRSGSVKLKGVNLKEIKRIVPIVVFEESLPMHEGIASEKQSVRFLLD